MSHDAELAAAIRTRLASAHTLADLAWLLTILDSPAAQQKYSEAARRQCGALVEARRVELGLEWPRPGAKGKAARA